MICKEERSFLKNVTSAGIDMSYDDIVRTIIQKRDRVTEVLTLQLNATQTILLKANQDHIAITSVSPSTHELLEMVCVYPRAKRTTLSEAASKKLREKIPQGLVSFIENLSSGTRRLSRILPDKRILSFTINPHRRVIERTIST